MEALAKYADHAARVERMLSEFRPFGEIEERIEQMSVSDDEKAALWLLAWSGKSRRVRRQTIIEALDFAARPG